MPPETPPAEDGGALRGRLARAWQRLTRPLWYEPMTEKARRWQRLVLQGPIGIVVGASFGVLASGPWGADPLALGFACGAAGLVFMYLLGQAESFLRIRPRSRGSLPPTVVRVGADLVGGGVMGWALSSVLGTDAAASLLAGASILAAYSYGVSHLLWGNVLDDLVRVASGNVATTRGPDFSREQALAARGRVDEAVELYEQWCEMRPGDPEPMIHAAWALREARRFEEALDWYRRALDAERIDGEQATRVVRHVWEITATKLGNAALALPDLERLLEEHPVAGGKEWVLREVEELGGRLPLGRAGTSEAPR